ncbi:MAG: YhcH/YjgK/YiaL family protein [Staphylococcus sp.]|nr:YhcH/YjgK/YiaL family protein [Staphylococcus sp.]
MSNEKVITPAEACEWVKSREWANGWNVNVDETVDALEFATQYERNKPLWDKLFKYLAETDVTALQPGKVVLEEGRLWINIPEAYTPKSIEDTRTENHRKFIDLQYTFEGDELYGLADPDKVTPTMEYDPVKDRTFYHLDAPASYVPAGADRFFLYFPKDLHQPSVRTSENPGLSRKIVGKIEYAE